LKTAVDTSVILDVLSADARFGEASRDALRTAYDRGALVACDVVWAEIRAHFSTDSTFEEMVGLLGVGFEPMDAETAALAGRLWRESRRGSGGTRTRVVADFLIGAHALLRAEALLTRDRGFYRRSFKSLRVIEPRAPGSGKKMG
jgi:predicted nucleic acid-binding protein